MPKITTKKWVRNTRECPHCSAHVSLSNFPRHQGSKSCRNGGKGATRPQVHPWAEWSIGSGLYRLPCGYEGTQTSCKNKLISKALQEHGKHNLIHHNKMIQSGLLEVHNKGKPLPSAQRKKISWSAKLYNQSHTKSEETRKRMSQARRNYLLNNPKDQLNSRLSGNRSKMTYPERVAHDWFVSQGIRATHNARVGRYYPDFLVGTTIVEIDGERWHSTPEQKERDQRRDRELVAMGYRVHRIRAKESIHARLKSLFPSS